jgi:hypothetical protein
MSATLKQQQDGYPKGSEHENDRAWCAVDTERDVIGLR